MHHHYLDVGLFVVIVVVVSAGSAAGGIALRRRIFAGPEQTRWREARLPLSHRQRIAVWWATARHRPTGRPDLARAQLAYAAYVQRSTDQTPLLKHRWLRILLPALFGLSAGINIGNGLRSGHASYILLAAGVLLAVTSLLWALMPRYILREGRRVQVLRRQLERRQAGLSGLN